VKIFLEAFRLLAVMILILATPRAWSAVNHFEIFADTGGTANVPAQTAGQSFGVRIVAYADSGTTVDTTFTSTVTLTSTATISSGATTVNFVSGVLDGHNITVTLAGAGQAITVTTAPGGVSNTFTVSPAVAHHLTIDVQPPTNIGAGATFTLSPQVSIRDQYENLRTADTLTVVGARSTGTGTLLGTTSVNAVGGVATFAALNHQVAETITVQFTSGVLTAATSNNVIVAPAVAHHLTIDVQPPTNIGAGATFTPSPQISIRDQYENLRTADTLTVVAARSAGTGTLLGTTSVNAVGGVSTFAALNHQVAGAITLQFTSGALTAAISNNITVSSAVANKLFISSITAAATATSMFSPQPVINILDQYGNVVTSDNATTVTAGLTTGNTGKFNGTKTVTAVNGVATFTDLSHDKKENIVIQFTSSPTLTAISSASIPVTHGVATSMTVVGFPSPQIAGTAGSATVTILDAGGNTVSNYTGIAHFTSTDGAAVLPANYTFVLGDAGVHMFTNQITLKTAGTQTITVTDTVTSSLTGAQSGITVNPNVATNVVVSGFPASQTAGTAGSITVRARDAYNNTATGYLGTVGFATTDSLAIFPVNYTFQVTDNGVKSFINGVTLKTTGTWTVTAMDTVTPAITGVQSGIVIIPAAASSLVVAGLSSPRVAGIAGSISVTARDPYNNIDTNYVGTVHLTSSDGQAVLPGNYTFVLGDNGVRNFSNAVTLKTVGTQSVTATDTVSVGINGTQSGVSVTPAAAATLSVSGFPSPQVAGMAGSFTVTALDAFGNVATGYSGTVHFTSTDTQAVLLSNYTFIGGDSGIHTFTNGATLKTSGSRSLIATDTVTSSITGMQSGITVTPSTAVGLVFTRQPSSATAGAALGVQPVVQARDVYGNDSAVGLAASVPVSVSLSLGAGSLTVPSNPDMGSAGTPGIATFVGLRIDESSDTKKVTVSATLNGFLVSVESNAFTVLPAVADHLAIEVQPPSSVGVGVTFTPNPVISIRDQFNNLRTADTLTVVAARSGGSGILQGTTSVNAVGGMASFAALNHQVAGNITLQFTSGALTAATSNNVTIVPGSAVALKITGSGAMAAGAANAITVTALDVYANTATTYSGATALTFTGGNPSTNPVTNPSVENDSAASISLGLTTTLSFTNGVAVSVMRLYRVETATIAVSDGVLSSTLGNRLSVTVVAASASRLVITGPATLIAGSVGNVTITATDPYGNTDTTYINAHALTFTGAQASGNPVTVPTVENNVGTAIAFGVATPLTFVAGVSVVNGTPANGHVRLYKAETAIIAASDGTIAAAAADRLSVLVTEATANQLVITGSATQVAGQTQDLTLTVQDQFGNTATSVNSVQSVTFAASGAGGGSNDSNNQARVSRATDGVEVNIGTATSLQFLAGVASTAVDPLEGKLRLVKVGTASITATTSGFIASTPLVVTVSAGVPANLRVTAVGTTTPTAGTATTIEVTLQDAGGNVVNATNQINLTLSSAPTTGSVRSSFTNHTITVGASTTTMTNVILDRAESGAVLTVADVTTALNSGDGPAMTVTNDKPVLSIGSGTLTYAGASGAIPFGAPGIAVSDVNSAGFTPFFSSATITVSFVSGAVTTEDVLQIRSAGLIRVSGTTVSYSANTIGTLSGGFAGAPLVVSLNSASATSAAVSELLENLCYHNIGGANPTTGIRVLRLDFNDGSSGSPGGSLSADPVTRSINVVVGNALPELLVNTSLLVNRSSTVTLDASHLQAVDDESGPTMVTFTVVIFPTEGELRLDSGAGPVVMSAGGTTTLTQADVSAGRVTYRHLGGSQPGDMFSFTVGDGTNTLPLTDFSFTVPGAISNPVLLPPIATMSYVEGAAASVVDTNAPTSTGTLVSDADTFDFALGTLTIEVIGANGLSAAHQNDQLTLRSQSLSSPNAELKGYIHLADVSGVSTVIHRQYPGAVPFPSISPSTIDLPIATVDPLLNGQNGNALRFNLLSGVGASAEPRVSPQAVARLIDNLQFANDSDNPPTTVRHLRITLAEAAPSTALGIANIALVLTPVNDAPIFVIPSPSPAPVQIIDALAGVPLRIQVLAGDADLPVGSALTYALTSITPPSAGVATINATSGALTFTPLPTYAGAVTLTVRGMDNQGAFTPADVSVLVLAGPTDLGPRIVSNPLFESFAGEALTYPLIIRPDPALPAVPAVPASSVVVPKVVVQLVGDAPTGAVLVAGIDQLHPILQVASLVRPEDGVYTFGIRVEIDYNDPSPSPHDPKKVRVGYQPVTLKIRAIGASN
jgi:Cadherin-like